MSPPRWSRRGQPRTAKTLLAGGVSIARQALAAGLVNEVVLHVVPKLVGRGVRLFDAGEVDLRCVETIQGEGAVHLRYEVRRPDVTRVAVQWPGAR